jgi:hypothetical protein
VRLHPSTSLPHIRLHDLRHVYATTLLLTGEPVHVVGAWLGHADPSITLRVYAHVIQELSPAVADKFALAVAGASMAQTAVLATALARRPPWHRTPPTKLGLTRQWNLRTRRDSNPNLLIRSCGSFVRRCPGSGWRKGLKRGQRPAEYGRVRICPARLAPPLAPARAGRRLAAVAFEHAGRPGTCSGRRAQARAVEDAPACKLVARESEGRRLALAAAHQF